MVVFSADSLDLRNWTSLSDFSISGILLEIRVAGDVENVMYGLGGHLFV